MEYQFSNIAPGVYTFGTAPLTGMPSSFSSAPFIHVQHNNEGKTFVAARSTTGFTLVDRGIGPQPVVTVTILDQL